jgi:hypothetical protein
LPTDAVDSGGECPFKFDLLDEQTVDGAAQFDQLFDRVLSVVGEAGLPSTCVTMRSSRGEAMCLGR